MSQITLMYVSSNNANVSTHSCKLLLKFGLTWSPLILALLLFAVEVTLAAFKAEVQFLTWTGNWKI